MLQFPATNPDKDSFVLVKKDGSVAYVPAELVGYTPEVPPTTGTSEVPATAKVSQAEGTDWVLAGKWQQGSDGEVYTSEPASTATLKFKGTYVSLVGVKDAHHGQAQIAIDGKAIGDFSQIAESRQAATEFYKNTQLTDGEHTIVVKPLAGKGTITVDYAKVQEVVPQVVTQPPTETVPPPTSGGKAVFTVKGSQVLRNGEPWYFTGWNSFVATGNCGAANEKMDKAAVENMISKLRNDGHGLLRIFFFRGWSKDRMQHLLDTAAKRNVYVLLCLDDAIAGCGTNQKNPAWFANSSMKDNYKSHMLDMISSYGTHPAIFAFEFFNEPGGYGAAGQLAAFYKEMRAVARQALPSLLFSSGTVAPYWVGGESQFKAIQENVDIVSTHEYDENMGASHWVKKAVELVPNKPHLVGEYGIKASSSSNYDNRLKLFKQKNAEYLAMPQVAAAIAWAWQPGNGLSASEYGNIDADQKAIDIINAAKR